MLENSEETNPDLLKTIMVPQNMHYLTDKLPNSNYNPLLTRLSNKMDYVNVNNTLNNENSYEKSIESKNSGIKLPGL